MEDDKNKLEKEKQERDRQIAELMKKLKESEMERRKLSETREMERKMPSERVSINYGIHVDVRFD